jgi:hypothetical protein
LQATPAVVAESKLRLTLKEIHAPPLARRPVAAAVSRL